MRAWNKILENKCYIDESDKAEREYRQQANFRFAKNVLKNVHFYCIRVLKKRRRWLQICELEVFLEYKKTARGKYLRENASYKGSEGFMARVEWFTWRNRSLNIVTPNWPRLVLQLRSFFAEPVHAAPKCVFSGSRKIISLAGFNLWFLELLIIASSIKRSGDCGDQRAIRASILLRSKTRPEKALMFWMRLCDVLSHGAKLVYRADTETERALVAYLISLHLITNWCKIKD